MMTTTDNTATTLESETCSRCGGSGSFSYCQSYGTKCFRCRGKGRTLTKRGAAASEYLTTLRSKRADQIEPGDVIWNAPVPGFSAGGWYRVTSVEPTGAEQRRVWIDGVEQQNRADLLTINAAAGYTLHGVAPESLVRVKQTPEQAAQTFVAALAYQATLTKSGKPRAR